LFHKGKGFSRKSYICRLKLNKKTDEKAFYSSINPIGLHACCLQAGTKKEQYGKRNNAEN
jgi:hypothetical protein